MAQNRVPTAIGEPLAVGQEIEGAEVRLGTPPVVLQTQPYAFVPLERPEQLRQWEEDLQKFYGISVDASGLRGQACETCSCGCTDDSGIMQ